MNEYVQKKEKDISRIESYIGKLKHDYEPLKTQEELNTIHKFFPMMKEQIRIAGFCEKIGLAFESIKKLLNGITLTSKAFKFYSPEHNQHFEAKDIQLKIEKETDNPEKLHLNLNGENIANWFNRKYQELQKTIASGLVKKKTESGQKKKIRI